jgi:RNA polymerase sigma-70 factor, ECF subfamily
MGCACVLYDAAMSAVVFVAELTAEARSRFSDEAELAAILARLREAACAAYDDIMVEPATFAAELARRLGAAATPQLLAAIRADHVHLAIACAAGNEAAIRRFEAELFDELPATGARMRVQPELVRDVESHLRHVLYVDEPGRRAALAAYSGRGDLRSYLRVIITRELVRLVDRGRRDINLASDAVLNLISPSEGPELALLREQYRGDVDAAIRSALANLSEPSRALLRYSLVDGWSIDRIGMLYGIHRATAARRIATAREELATAIRTELATRLGIAIDEVDSIVRMVQSRIDVSLERLLGPS